VLAGKAGEEAKHRAWEDATRMDRMAKAAGITSASHGGNIDRFGAYNSGLAMSDVRAAYAVAKAEAPPAAPDESEAYFRALSRIETDRRLRESRGGLRAPSKRGSLL
jgi:hypothetical protein